MAALVKPVCVVVVEFFHGICIVLEDLVHLNSICKELQCLHLASTVLDVAAYCSEVGTGAGGQLHPPPPPQYFNVLP